MITEINYKNIRNFADKVSVHSSFVMLVFLVLLVIAGSANAKFKSNSKIVGGAAVRENAAPYMAALLYYENEVYGCGGAIIHPNFVITAGHCFENAEASDVKVLVGTNVLSNGTDIRQVDQVIVHDR
jgi:secreted trypsin-like serine protease